MGSNEKNNVEYEHYVWTCPGCNVSYINSTYCYPCDINEDDEDRLPSDSEK